MKLLLFLLLLPTVVFGKIRVEKYVEPRNETGFNLGYAPDNAFQSNYFSRGGYVRASLSQLKNRGSFQYGFALEGGTNSNDYWYLSPAALLNFRWVHKHHYLYAGTMAGYICSQDMVGTLPRVKGIPQGYVFGIQGGYVKPFAKHLSITSEFAIRSTQIWTRYDEGYGLEQFHTETDVIIYFPVTIGLRYRF